MKTCRLCSAMKATEDFGVDRHRPGGRRDECRVCWNARERERRAKNPDVAARRDAATQRWAKANPEKARAKKNRNHIARMARMPDHVRALAREGSKAWRARNPEKVAASNRRMRDQHPEVIAACRKRWSRANPEAVRRQGERRRSRLQYRIEATIRAGIHRGLRGGKRGRTWDVLRYTLAELTGHLEARFASGMSWDNYGEWHIDHIVPLSSFRFGSTDDPAFREAWALSNLQPLWAEENMSKGNRRVA